MGLMSLAGHGPKHGFRHGCQIITQTSPVLYKDVNNAASSLPLGIDRPAQIPDMMQKSHCTKLVANQASF